MADNTKKEKVVSTKKEKVVSFKTLNIVIYNNYTWESKKAVNITMHGTKEVLGVSELRKRGLEIMKKHHPEETMFTIKFGSGSDSPLYFYQI